MPTDDMRAEAIEAAARVMFDHYEGEYDASHLTWREFADDAAEVVDAATPRLLAPIRALAGEDDPLRGPVTTNATLRRVLDAIESGATSEGGRDE